MAAAWATGLDAGFNGVFIGREVGPYRTNDVPPPPEGLVLGFSFCLGLLGHSIKPDATIGWSSFGEIESKRFGFGVDSFSFDRIGSKWNGTGSSTELSLRWFHLNCISFFFWSCIVEKFGADAASKRAHGFRLRPGKQLLQPCAVELMLHFPFAFGFSFVLPSSFGYSTCVSIKPAGNSVAFFFLPLRFRLPSKEN